MSFYLLGSVACRGALTQAACRRLPRGREWMRFPSVEYDSEPTTREVAYYGGLPIPIRNWLTA